MSGVYEIGSRRELFVDDFIVGGLEGDVRFRQHRPRPENVVLSDDRPWESSINYFSVLQDGALYRMYYRGFHHGRGEQAMGEPTCYAESEDGIVWRKPALRLFSFEGSDENNIVLGGDYDRFPETGNWRGYLGREIRWRADFVPFIDRKAGTPERGRYKALIRGARGYHQIESRRYDYGMYPCESPDGLNWTTLTEFPVITKGRFDSQNLGLYDPVHRRYVAFVRDTHGAASNAADDAETWTGNVCRDVRVCFSDDFIHWGDPVYLKYPGSEPEQLYTSAVTVYDRAPHLLLGFPTRYYEETSQTEPVFMVSRDGGESFRRWPEALIPRDTPSERDGNRSNYMAHGLLRGNDRELFCYATEGYMDGPSRRLRRFVWRTDGFVSVGVEKTGEVLTVPMRFLGDELECNYTSKKDGCLRVEICAEDGSPLPGRSLAECEPLTGDSVEETVIWRSAIQLGTYSGKPVRLRFRMENTELFSFCFKPQNTGKQKSLGKRN